VLQLFFSRSFTPLSALYAVALGGFFGWVAGYAGYGRSKWSRPFARVILSRHWNFIKWMTPTTILEVITGNAPQLIGTRILDDLSIGAFRLAESISNILMLPLNSIMLIAVSDASREKKLGGLAMMNQGSSSRTFALAFIIIGSSAPVFIFSYFLFSNQLGPLFDQFNIVLLCYIVVRLLAATRLGDMVALHVAERPSMLVWPYGVGCVLALALSYPLVVKFGVSGIGVAALASSIGITLTLRCNWTRTSTSAEG